jgi:hypothetical protein
MSAISSIGWDIDGAVIASEAKQSKGKRLAIAELAPGLLRRSRSSQ